MKAATPDKQISGVEVRLLGETRCLVGGDPIGLGGSRHRALLALLALDVGRPVSRDRLVVELFGEDSSDAAAGTLQGYVHRLRQRLPAGSIETTSGGYRLAVSEDAIDAVLFLRYVRAAAAALRTGAWSASFAAAESALAMWPAGQPLADLSAYDFAVREAARLEEIRFGLVETWASAGLQLAARPGVIVDGLDLATRSAPFRERLWELLMLALYRDGRQADALACAQRLRETLRDELGLDPGQAVVVLEAAILRGDLSVVSSRDEIGGPAAVQFVRSGRHHLAYRAEGTGPEVALVFGVNVGTVLWGHPISARLLEELAQSCRVLTFDPAGTGASDEVDEPFGLSDRVEHLRSVLDAAGFVRPVLFAPVDGGPVAMAFAAAHPDRLSGLVLYNTFARVLWAQDWPDGYREVFLDAVLARYLEEWGTGFTIELWAPSLQDRPGARDWWADAERLTSGRRQAHVVSHEAMRYDVRHVLSAITAPTLVLHSADNPVVPLAQGRYIADHLDGSTFRQLPGVDHSIWADDLAVIAGIVARFAAAHGG